MRRPTPIRISCGMLAALCVLAGALPAAADEATGEEEATKVRRSRQILSHIDDPAPDHAARGFGESFHFHKKSGIEYRRSLQLGDRELKLRVRGPIQKEWSVGLGFELEF